MNRQQLEQLSKDRLIDIILQGLDPQTRFIERDWKESDTLEWMNRQRLRDYGREQGLIEEVSINLVMNLERDHDLSASDLHDYFSWVRENDEGPPPFDRAKLRRPAPVPARRTRMRPQLRGQLSEKLPKHYLVILTHMKLVYETAGTHWLSSIRL